MTSTPFINAFTLLALLHFMGDWLFQTTYMAWNKGRSIKALALHVVVYTALFAIVLSLMNFATPARLALICLWLLVSHFAIDTYKPIYYWRKFVHRDPNCQTWEGFLATYNDYRGFTVNLVVDQIFHLLALLPIAFVKHALVNFPAL